jgi:hypothetical protein
MSVPAGQPAPQIASLAKFACVAVAASVAGVVCALSTDMARAPGVIVGRMWPAQELLSFDDVDHRIWDRLLERHVDGQGNVAYSAWNESPADMASLDGYLNELSRADPAREATREARLAFWINAYNALTVRGILREYPARGGQSQVVRKPGFNFWRDVRLQVAKEDYSLDEIEHKKLLPLREPRIHFAIVCGSRGCPPLRNRAYAGPELERQLGDNARRFFADPLKIDYDRTTGRLRLSPILKWHLRDCGENEDELLDRISAYFPKEISAQFHHDRPRLEYLDYDRDLNEQSAPGSDPPVPPGIAEDADDDFHSEDGK